MATVITNCKIVNSKEIINADIRIVGEKIEKIGDNLVEKGDRVIDAKGYYALPGGIDVHTHFDAEAHGIIADSFETGTKAALMGGNTCIIDYAEPVKGGSLGDGLREWNKKTEKSYTDYSYHMTIVDWNEDISKEMGDMIKEGISSFKIFLAYEDLKLDDTSIYSALKRGKELNALINFHCENGDLVEKLRQEAIKDGNIEPIYHMKTRPSILEKEAISRLITIAKLIDTPIYIVHLSSKEGYEEIKRAKEEGVKIFTETCPQYLLLNEDYYIPKGEDLFEGAKYIMSPPLRDIESSKILWKGLKNGIIDIVATDHCAFNYEGQKNRIKDFTQVPNGGPGVENRFKLIYTYGVRNGKIDIKKMVEVLSENPAKIFNLYPKKGIIKENADADIVLFNPEPKSIIKAKDQYQNVDYNLYEGFEQYGKFEYIFLRGEVLVQDEKYIGRESRGKFIKRI